MKEDSLAAGYWMDFTAIYYDCEKTISLTLEKPLFKCPILSFFPVPYPADAVVPDGYTGIGEDWEASACKWDLKPFTPE